MPAVAIERQVGSLVAGKYRLIRVLGRGGMGVVYEAEHSMTRRHVAVKILHAHHDASSDAGKRFLNEAQSAGRIQHPNVVEVLDAGNDVDGSLYLVLELLAGQDLATLLARQRRLEVAETVTITAQVLQALVVAHRIGIIHRDIKPENIYLTKSMTGDTHVKILDFGISKAMNQTDGPALSVTQTNTTVGTPHYMSPEQARGERTIDTRADLWAVGVVMYECLAGRVPFDGETYNDQIVRVITEPHVPLSGFDVPLELSRVVDKALEKDRNQRYARAADILADIRKFIEQHPEYSSVPAHYLREPAPVKAPPMAGPGMTSKPTIETSQDPAFDPSLPPPRDTSPSAIAASSSLIESSMEDVPTTVRMMEELGLPGPGPRPLAGWPAAGMPPPGYAPPPAVPSEDPAAQKRRIFMIVAVLVGAVALGTALAIATKPHHAAPTPTATTSQAVTLRFTGIPSDAQILVAGAPAGTHGAVTVPRSSQLLAIEIRANGFVPLELRTVPESDQTLPLTMVPMASAAPEPMPAPPAAIAPPPAPVLAPPAPVHAPEPAPLVAPTQPVEPAPAVPSAVAPAVAAPTPVEPAPAPNPVRPTPAPAPSHPAPRVTPHPAASANSAAAPRATEGFITVRAQPPCTLAIDGHLHGHSPLVRMPAPIGLHRVLCRTPTGAIRSRAVSVVAGHEAVVEFAP